MKRRLMIALGLIALMTAAFAGPAYADVAPPQNPPGASVKNGSDGTKVRMVSENVLITVGDYFTDDLLDARMVSPLVSSHVEATFNMQNMGDTAESFDVWFPTGQ